MKRLEQPGPVDEGKPLNLLWMWFEQISEQELVALALYQMYLLMWPEQYWIEKLNLY